MAKDYVLNGRFGEDAITATGAALTDNSGGTASQTIAAIGATYDQAEVRNAVASLADEINKLVADVAALNARITK